MKIPSSSVDFWAAFCADSCEDRSARFYQAFHFSDDEPTANALAQLVITGVKRATAGLLWSVEHDGTLPPKPGALSIVTNWSGRPMCVIETTAVDVVPFDHVGAEFAATEGEGDGSLGDWRRAHWAYFARECARFGREPSPFMPVVCERFSVIYRANR